MGIVCVVYHAPETSLVNTLLYGVSESSLPHENKFSGFCALHPNIRLWNSDFKHQANESK